MASRAKAPKRKAAAKGKKGKIVSRGTVAVLPKQSKARVKKRGIGDNSGDHRVPDEVYERHLSKINTTEKAMERAKAEYDQAKGVHQNAYKAAKNDGCNTDAIRLARKLDKMDHGAVVTDYADVGRVLNIMRSPLGSEQMDLFGSISAPAVEVDVALQGLNAGKNAEPIDNCPYPAGSENYVMWRDNWEKGQEQNRQGLQS